MRFWHWFSRGSDTLGYIEKWNPAVAERHAATTARMLLGSCGPARIVGDRVVEAREARIQRQREAEQQRAGQRRRFGARS